MNKYTIYCTPEQTKKALELGAPIENHNYTFGNNETCTYLGKDYTEQPALDWFAQQPTAEQMIGWLEEQGIWIHFCKPNQRPTLLSFSVSNINKPFRRVFVGGEYSTRKEATIAAISAALEYLTNNKK